MNALAEKSINALEELNKAGAHFVLLKNGKEPYVTEWQDNAAPLDQVLKAQRSGKNSGLMPKSLGKFVLDLDLAGFKDRPKAERDAEFERRLKHTIKAVGEPLCVCRTPSGGAHLYYRRPNVKEKIHDTDWLYGQTRADSGQCVLYDPPGVSDAFNRLSKAVPIDLSKIPPSKSKTTKLVTIEDHIERLRNAKDNDASRHDAWRDSAKQLQEEGKLSDTNIEKARTVWRESGKTNIKEFDDLVSSAREKFKSKIPFVKCTRASQMKPKRARWLWDGWIPLQSISLIAGIEGLGKSTYALHLAARLTRGQLAGEYFGNPVNVSLYMTEDDSLSVLLPRLKAAGADLDRVMFFDGIQIGERLDPLFIEKDIKALKNHIEEHDIKLLILDPIVTRIGKTRDDNNYGDVRAVLETLGQLFQNNRASCLGVTHFNKSTGPIENRVIGSRAWRAVIRSLICVHRDENNEHERIITHSKCNYGPSQQSIKFGFKSETVAQDEEDGSDIKASQIVDRGFSKLSDKEAMAAADNRHMKDSGTPRDRAENWLVKYFDNLEKQLAFDGKEEGVLRATIMKAAIREGHSESTVKRVAKELGVTRVKKGKETLWNYSNEF